MLLNNCHIFLLVLVILVSHKLVVSTNPAKIFVVPNNMGTDFDDGLYQALREFRVRLDIMMKEERNKIEEEKRKKIYRERLASRIKGSMLRDFHGRF